MAIPVNATTTKKEGWRELCLKWVKAGVPFELQDMEEEHFAFCHEICCNHDYSFQYRCKGMESVAKFIPMD